jgi:hypothetical protein
VTQATSCLLLDLTTKPIGASVHWNTMRVECDVLPRAIWFASSRGGPHALLGGSVMWTAISSVLMFVVLLFPGRVDPRLRRRAEQLRERRAHRLELEHECTKQALIALD